MKNVKNYTIPFKLYKAMPIKYFLTMIFLLILLVFGFYSCTFEEVNKVGSVCTAFLIVIITPYLIANIININIRKNEYILFEEDQILVKNLFKTKIYSWKDIKSLIRYHHPYDNTIIIVLRTKLEVPFFIKCFLTDRENKTINIDLRFFEKGINRDSLYNLLLDKAENE